MENNWKRKKAQIEQLLDEKHKLRNMLNDLAAAKKTQIYNHALPLMNAAIAGLRWKILENKQSYFFNQGSFSLMIIEDTMSRAHQFVIKKQGYNAVIKINTLDTTVEIKITGEGMLYAHQLEGEKFMEVWNIIQELKEAWIDEIYDTAFMKMKAEVNELRSRYLEAKPKEGD